MQRLKYLIPNSCTAFSMLLGLASVYNSTEGHYVLAAWMIVWGVLLDKLDGTTARLFNASSKLGAELDSFADFVSFGIATVALFFFSLRDMSLVHPGWLSAASGAYVVATAVRLARFNVSAPPMSKYIFYGLPTTFMGGVLSLWYLVWDKYKLPEEWMSAMPFVLLVCSLAMVSNIRAPKLRSSKYLAGNIFLFFTIALCYTLGITRQFPEVMLFFAVSLVSFGVVKYAIFPPKMEDFEDKEENEVHIQPSF